MNNWSRLYVEFNLKQCGACHWYVSLRIGWSVSAFLSMVLRLFSPFLLTNFVPFSILGQGCVHSWTANWVWNDFVQVTKTWKAENIDLIDCVQWFHFPFNSHALCPSTATASLTPYLAILAKLNSRTSFCGLMILPEQKLDGFSADVVISHAGAIWMNFFPRINLLGVRINFCLNFYLVVVWCAVRSS